MPRLWSPDAHLAALRFAATAHGGQKVPGSELPYVVHLSLVAAEVMLAIAGEGVEFPDLAVQCALLHDTVEDTPTTLAELGTRFGPAVAEGVDALTRRAGPPAAEAMRDSLTRIRARPREIWMVKLADRIVNLQPPPAHWDAARAAAYLAEARMILESLGAASDTLSRRLAARIAAYPAIAGIPA